MNSMLPKASTYLCPLHLKYRWADQFKQRLIVIGDVHGCYDELKILLAKCQAKEGDQVVYVGDLVNKGPHSVDVIRHVRTSGAWCVRGNHDDSALKAYKIRRELKEKLATSELENLKKDDGLAAQESLKKALEELAHYDYTDDFTREDVEFLEAMPFTIQIPDLETLIVHAGLIPGVPLEHQTPDNMYRMRNLIEKKVEENGKEKCWEAVESEADGCIPWASAWSGPEHVYFGHDAKRLLQQYPHATGLDTGCCYGKNLTAMILPEKKLVSVPALKTYEAPKG